MKRAGVVTGALVVAALLVVGVWWGVAPPVVGQASVPCYMMQGGAKFVAGSGCEWEVQAGATLDIQSGSTLTVDDLQTTDDVIAGDDLVALDDLNVTGDAVINGDLAVGGNFDLAVQDTLTLTDNAVLTPTGSFQPITAAAAIGIDGGTNIVHTANVLVLVNVGAQTITFTETTGLISAGNIALGAGDSATLVWRGTSWYQIAGSNN